MDTPNEEVSNQEVSEEAQEAAVNEAAKAEIESATPSKEQTTPTDNKGTVSGPIKAEQKVVPPNTAKKGEPEFDVRKSYEELRKDYTRKTQALSQYEKQLRDMQAAQKTMETKLTEATKKPVNLEQFFTDLRAQGPDAILPYLRPELEKIQTQVQETLGNAQRENQGLRLEISLMNRRMDSKAYPDFSTLEPKMRELAESGNAPIDFTKPMDEVIDALYNLVRSKNSEEAIKVAEKAAYSKAQAELAKEAKTAVAGGGKGTSTTPADMWKMPLDKLEQLVAQMHGVADRD